MKFALNQWETAFFGRDIYQLGEQFDPDKSLNIPVDYALLQAKVPTSDLARVTFLQQQHFQLVETEIQFTLDLALFRLVPTACHCRLAEKEDLVRLKKWIGNAFQHTRFRRPYFTQVENQRFYQQWIENAVLGKFDDFCLIAEQEGRLQGAVSLRLCGNQAKLGLFTVAPEYQRQGIGKTLLNEAVRFLQHRTFSQGLKQDTKIESLHITTQLSNHRAINFYQSFGAKWRQSYYWFYRVGNHSTYSKQVIQP